MKIVWMPLEPLEARYTKDWAKWYPHEFQRCGQPYITVKGKSLTDSINIGSVLDAYGTNYYKMTQMAKLIHLIQDGQITGDDVLLFADLWYPGIEALQYIKNLGGTCPKITGVLHAGTWDDNDFTVRSGMRPWGHPLEEAWFQIYDLIFVGTNYHRNLITNYHRVNPDKIIVTGLPFYTPEVRRVVKEDNVILFPHRLDPEKNLDEYCKAVAGLSVKSFRTAQVCQNKEQYYQLLSQGTIAVSTADQETFGYAMLEAESLGCIPIVPRKACYPEMYDERLTYNSFQDLNGLLKKVLENLLDYRSIAEDSRVFHQKLYNRSISRIITSILNKVV
jgi:glycosyltransferase involved in cell wall biosynthesis